MGLLRNGRIAIWDKLAILASLEDKGDECSFTKGV